ncbi:hypothetical protein M316_0108 [Nitrincola phage 1M3-16]|uniref:hypothetical protein n=1 Tax=Nitrincola phage 1M3-16 TaxID=1472912 RepID=UPI000444D5FC|nr:hypothetical protein GJ22_gp044 [Nitrincola phage 1M3-16]AHX01173.1 hypothetical protein M316_0108 [Nitrincola phage 1M3-16]
MRTFLKYLRQIFIAVDQLVNCLIYSSHDKEHYGYGWGYADETISARCWRLRETTWFWRGMQEALDILFFWDKGLHCYLSYMAEWDKHQLPSHYKDAPEALRMPPDRF